MVLSLTRLKVKLTEIFHERCFTKRTAPLFFVLFFYVCGFFSVAIWKFTMIVTKVIVGGKV